jgi:hypothetical protein
MKPDRRYEIGKAAAKQLEPHLGQDFYKSVDQVLRGADRDPELVVAVVSLFFAALSSALQVYDSLIKEAPTAQPEVEKELRDREPRPKDVPVDEYKLVIRVVAVEVVKYHRHSTHDDSTIKSDSGD